MLFVLAVVLSAWVNLVIEVVVAIIGFVTFKELVVIIGLVLLIGLMVALLTDLVVFIAMVVLVLMIAVVVVTALKLDGDKLLSLAVP